MKLEIGNFHVKDIVFGDALSYKDGILTINKEEALDFIRQDARITEADLYIVKPGEMVRLCPVKEAIEPRCRLDGQGLFPAYTSGLRQAGEGVLHALKECSVIVVGRHMGGFQDGIIDMGGPGQKHTYFGNLINIVLVGDTNEDFERFEQQKMNDALRRAGRVKASSAFFGNLLGVKPIIVADADGEQAAFRKVKGRTASLREIVSLLGEHMTDPESQTVYVAHSDCPEEEVEQVKAFIREIIPCKDIYTGYIGPIIGASIGPGAFAIFGIGKEITFRIGKGDR